MRKTAIGFLAWMMLASATSAQTIYHGFRNKEYDNFWYSYPSSGNTVYGSRSGHLTFYHDNYGHSWSGLDSAPYDNDDE